MLLPSIFKNNFADDFFDGFDDLFKFPSIARIPASGLMTTNVKTVDKDYHLEIELPGYNKKDITVSLDKGYLTVSAIREESKDERDRKDRYVRRERYSGSCKRSFYVGENLNEDDFKATYENGLLTLVFPTEKELNKVDDKKYISIR